MNRTELLPDRPGIPPMAKLPDPEVIDPEALARAYDSGEIDLICVVGPTASGKTRYAVQLAKDGRPRPAISRDSIGRQQAGVQGDGYRHRKGPLRVR